MPKDFKPRLGSGSSNVNRSNIGLGLSVVSGKDKRDKDNSV